MKIINKEQIVQLREHDLNRGKDKSNTPVYPVTHVSLVEDIDSVLQTKVIKDLADVEQITTGSSPMVTLVNTYKLEPGVFYNISNWQTSSGNSLNFRFSATDDEVYAGRFTAWADDMAIGLPAGISIPTETVDIVRNHTYEFNIWQGVCIIQDVTTSRSIYNEPGLEPKS